MSERGSKTQQLAVDAPAQDAFDVHARRKRRLRRLAVADEALMDELVRIRNGIFRDGNGILAAFFRVDAN